MFSTNDENNNLDMRGMNYLPLARNHRDIYICRGDEEEIWMPSFTYNGFRYCLVIGLKEEQAIADLLSYAVMHSDLKSVGDFHCSDETLNKIQAATRNADLANFYYIPTDCPQREKMHGQRMRHCLQSRCCLTLRLRNHMGNGCVIFVRHSVKMVRFRASFLRRDGDLHGATDPHGTV